MEFLNHTSVLGLGASMLDLYILVLVFWAIWMEIYPISTYILIYPPYSLLTVNCIYTYKLSTMQFMNGVSFYYYLWHAIAFYYISSRQRTKNINLGWSLQDETFALSRVHNTYAIVAKSLA